MGMLWGIWALIRGFLVDRAALTAEVLALRQQINVLQRSVKRPKLQKWVGRANLPDDDCRAAFDVGQVCPTY